jgi:hypothetical protein
MVLAECPEGKQAVQLSTPSGNVKTLCIPDAGIQGIENAAEHSGGTIVTATCDCWSAEELKLIDSNTKVDLVCYNPQTTYVGVEGVECNLVYESDGSPYSSAYIILLRDYRAGIYECKNYYNPYYKTGIRVEEYNACVSLVQKYVAN